MIIFCAILIIMIVTLALREARSRTAHSFHMSEAEYNKRMTYINECVRLTAKASNYGKRLDPK